MFRFDEKVVVVTGGSLGIGKATAMTFAGQGGRVVMASVDAAAGEQAVAEIDAGAVHVMADVSREAEVEALIGETLRRFGRLDVLVNNAGVYREGDVAATSLAEWERILSVNLTGAFLCTRHALTALAESRGVVVNVASEAGVVGIAGQVAYNVSKAGVISLTRSCAVDLAPRGIRVNCVCPGTTATPLVVAKVQASENPERARRTLEEMRPLNRLGAPEEIAAAILYLASAEAGYATGAVLSIDGGYTAQ
jgi:NAD(P)-dependent dehydrogenase (short-subunit alcohol dehydrogenase family)